MSLSRRAQYVKREAERMAEHEQVLRALEHPLSQHRWRSEYGPEDIAIGRARERQLIAEAEARRRNDRKNTALGAPGAVGLGRDYEAVREAGRKTGRRD